MRALPLLMVPGLLAGLWSDPSLAQERAVRVAAQAASLEGVVDEEVARDRVLSRPANLELRDVPLHDALARLHETAGIPLLFSPTLLPEVRVSCDCGGASVEAVLDRIVRGQGLDYLVRGGQVMIYRPDRERRALPVLPSSFLAASVDVTPVLEPVMPVLEAPRAQAVGMVTGRVSDSGTGQPLVSAEVFIQDAGIGVLTQQNGRYLLQGVRAGTHTVSVQRIGYRVASAEVEVLDGQTVIQDFALTEEALQLDAIVVTGTPAGTQVRAIGNAVGRVQAEQIVEVAAVETVQDLLGGREAGLSFHRQSGNIGTGSQIRIRGVSSVSMGSQPLIYVDGVRVDNQVAGGPDIRDGAQVSTLDDFSPDEIESIEIIKGPAAATLYGTEASAGVIQIITKRGRTGAPQFDVSVRTGGTWLPNISEMVGESYGRDDDGNVISFNIYEAEKAAGREHFQTGLLQAYAASMRGGTDAIRYFLSADFDDNEGIVSYNWQKQTNLRANVSVLASEEVTLDVSLGYITGKTSFMQQRTAWGMWEQFQWANPEGQDRILRGFLRARPEEIADNEAIRDMNRFTGSATVMHRPTGWLTHKLIVGMDLLNETNSVLFPRRPEGADHDFGALSLGYLELDRPNRRYNTLDYAASLTYGYGNNITLTSSVGAQYYARSEEIVRGTGRIFPAPQIRTLSGAAQTTSAQTFVENKSMGVYVQQEAGINGRIFLTAAVRGDDNSAFGTNFDAAIYPKFSATWVLSEEPFWDGWLEVVNQFRFRSAWGKAGRQPDTFAAVTLYRPEVGPGGNPAVSTDVLGNPDLGPEVSSELELGFDAAFLDDRLSAEFTYYNQKVSDALISVPVSPVSGFSGSQSVNLGQLSNWGWEIALDARVYERDAFAWNVGVGFASTENRVDDLGGTSPTNELREGRPYPFLSARQALDVQLDPVTRNVTSLTCDGGTGSDGRDRGGSPTPCTQAPLVRLGNGLAIPKYEGSLNTTLTLFGNLRLYAMAEWRGEHWKSLTDASCRHTCFYTSRAAVERPDEYATTVAAIDGLIPGSPYTAWFDASFAKLREVSATYTFTDALASRIGASRASLNVAARNLWTIWQAQKDIGGAPITDPEARNATSLTASNSNVPPLASFVITLRASF
jgi:TonB-linked SusC/RagA family outer membrane protein